MSIETLQMLKSWCSNLESLASTGFFAREIRLLWAGSMDQLWWVFVGVFVFLDNICILDHFGIFCWSFYDCHMEKNMRTSNPTIRIIPCPRRMVTSFAAWLFNGWLSGNGDLIFSKDGEQIEKPLSLCFFQKKRIFFGIFVQSMSCSLMFWELSMWGLPFPQKSTIGEVFWKATFQSTRSRYSPWPEGSLHLKWGRVVILESFQAPSEFSRFDLFLREKVTADSWILFMVNMKGFTICCGISQFLQPILTHTRLLSKKLNKTPHMKW